MLDVLRSYAADEQSGLMTARMCLVSFFFQAEDGIRDLVRSRGLGDVYKRQILHIYEGSDHSPHQWQRERFARDLLHFINAKS